MPPLADAETWVFDLDNTLYPARFDLASQVERRIEAFVAAALGVDAVEARQVRIRYLQSHGATLGGLVQEHGIEPMTYLDDVHAVDLSAIPPDPRLDAAIGRLTGRKVVFTNASRAHAERVLLRIGVDHGHFDGIFDIAAAGYCPKPARAAYVGLFHRHGVDPATAVFLDDQPRNLETAAALGMSTVLVHSGGDASPQAAGPIHHVTDDLAGWLETIALARP